mmetsp:Transcript_35425/g.70884  ORF Transcript_35425/g.70884 Transcript_35425/m.70884 type:complete len:218 (+) Transcript_35425:75-728(+)
MPQFQITKTGSFHSRFQVKWRRRREGKTDYFSRRRLLYQDKRKYNSPKYRIVVRMTKRNIICQFVQSRFQGDHVLHVVYSKNLETFGIKVGKTSFSASFLIGFLLAKKVLKKIFFSGEKIRLEKKTPNAILDIGLKRVTTGSKVFAVLCGVVDGGINIPHNEKRFPGYKSSKMFDPDLLNQRIKGTHIKEYMQFLKEEDNEKYQKHFSKIIQQKNGK